MRGAFLKRDTLHSTLQPVEKVVKEYYISLNLGV
jgi:hypothetical protein